MLFAVVRIRGRVNLSKEIDKTLAMLRLNRKNHCVLINSTPSNVGMLLKVQKYITWGEINKDILKRLLQKRGRIVGNKRLTEEYLREKIGKSIDEFADSLISLQLKLKDIPGLKPVFRLKPPTGGFERKGIKYPFSLGGVFGYRGEKINDLLKRMI